MFTMVRAASDSLKRFMQTQIEQEPLLAQHFAAGDGSMHVSLRDLRKMREANLEGLSVWLCSLVPNEVARNMALELDPSRQSTPTPFPLRLNYLFTPVLTSLEDDQGPILAQEIIGKVIETWHQFPVLSGSDLADELKDENKELRIQLQSLEPHLISDIWRALGEPMRLCVAYEVTV